MTALATPDPEGGGGCASVRGMSQVAMAVLTSSLHAHCSELGREQNCFQSFKTSLWFLCPIRVSGTWEQYFRQALIKAYFPRTAPAGCLGGHSHSLCVAPSLSPCRYGAFPRQLPAFGCLFPARSSKGIARFIRLANIQCLNKPCSLLKSFFFMLF